MGIDDLLNRMRIGSQVATYDHDYEYTGPMTRQHRLQLMNDHDADTFRILKNKTGDFSVAASNLTPPKTTGTKYVDFMGRRLAPSVALEGLTEREAKGFVTALAENKDARSELWELLQKNDGNPQNLKQHLANLITSGQEGISQTPSTLMSPGSKYIPIDPNISARHIASEIYDQGFVRDQLRDAKFSDLPGMKFSTNVMPKDDLPDIYFNKGQQGFNLGKPSLMNRIFGSGVDGSNIPWEHDAATHAKNVIGGVGNSFRNYNLIQRASDMRDAGSKFGKFLSKAYVPSKLLGMGGGVYSNARALLGNNVSTTEKVLNGTGTLAATMPAILSKARSASRTLGLIKNLGAKVKYGRLKAIASVLPEAAVGMSGFLPLLYGKKQAQ